MQCNIKLSSGLIILLHTVHTYIYKKYYMEPQKNKHTEVKA